MNRRQLIQLSFLECADFIEGDAWLPAKHENKALGTGKPTHLGECYRDA